VILLDTHAVIWLEQRHRRTAAFARRATELYVSPASVLELQFLAEAGRIRLRASTARTLLDEGPWPLDDPPAAAWFGRACEVGWTRDPFDRLLVAHAGLRGWRLATADQRMLANLPGSRVIPL
jgi:PIN domain nuclease of toxin-antitoxin system